MLNNVLEAMSPGVTLPSKLCDQRSKEFPLHKKTNNKTLSQLFWGISLDIKNELDSIV